MPVMPKQFLILVVQSMYLRADTEFDKFWDNAMSKAVLQLSDPTVPRVDRPPRQTDLGSCSSTFLTPKDYFRKIYFDNIHGEISR